MKPLYLQILGVVLILIIIISISMYKKKPLIEGNFSLGDLANVPSNLAIVSAKLDDLEAKMAGFTLTEEDTLETSERLNDAVTAFGVENFKTLIPGEVIFLEQ